MEELDDLMKRILKRLTINLPPSALQLGVDQRQLNYTLEGLKEMKLVTFDYIKDHPVFKGEPTNIKLTPRGREIGENLRVPI